MPLVPRGPAPVKSWAPSGLAEVDDDSYARLADLYAGDALLGRPLAEALGGLWRHTAVLVVTEFGRTVRENGTRGMHHGTGGAAFVAGGAIEGGRVITDWPSLSQGGLLDGRDLRPTTDLRSVLKGVLGEEPGVAREALEQAVFPESRAARPLRRLIRG